MEEEILLLSLVLEGEREVFLLLGGDDKVSLKAKAGTSGARYSSVGDLRG